jgi:hypothetical protein
VFLCGQSRCILSHLADGQTADPMDTVDTSQLRLAGALLLFGGVAFNIGALSPPWEQWSAPLLRALQVVGERRVAWYWIHAWFVVGVLITVLGFVTLAHAVRARPDASLFATLIATAYITGAIFWLINIAFRGSIQVWAADEVLRTGAVPAEYEPWRRWAGLLFMAYMVLAYLANAALGLLVLRSGMAPRWAGWFAIVMGLTGGAIVGINVPLIVHFPLMLIGAFLMRTT